MNLESIIGELTMQDRHTLVFVAQFISILKEKDEDPAMSFDAVNFLMKPEFRVETEAVVERKRRGEVPTEEECEEALFKGFDEYFDHVGRSYRKKDFLHFLAKLEKICQSIEQDVPIIKYSDFLSLLHLILDDMNEDYKRQFAGETVLSAWPILDGDAEDPWAEVRKSKEQTKGDDKESH